MKKPTKIIARPNILFGGVAARNADA